MTLDESEPRFDRRTLVAMAGGLAVAAIERERAAQSRSAQQRARGSCPHTIWPPPAAAAGSRAQKSSGAPSWREALPGPRRSWTEASSPPRSAERSPLSTSRPGVRTGGGASVWSTPTVPPGANGGGVIAPASVDLRANLAYVATGSPYRALPGANPGTESLLALRLGDGAVVWSDQVHRGDTHGFDFNSAPVILGRILVAASKDGFQAWDRVTRRRLWHRRLTPALSQKGGVAGPMNGPEGGPVATDGMRIYVLSNDAARNSCVAAALAPATGHVLWRRRLPSFSFAAPALAGDRLFATGADGMLRGLETATGEVVATVPLGAPSTGAPAVAQGKLVVGAGAEPFLPGHLLVCIGPHGSHR
jgi:hypothetical protein